MKKIFGGLYLTYLKAKLRFVRFYNKSNTLAQCLILIISLAIIIVCIWPFIKFPFIVGDLKNNKVAAEEYKEQLALEEQKEKEYQDLIEKNSIGNGDIVIDFTECYEYTLSGISPLITVETKMNDYVGDNFIDELPINVKVSIKAANEDDENQEIGSGYWCKNGDTLIFEIDADPAVLEDCNYTFTNIYKEVKVENFLNFFDENNPLTEEKINQWHEFLKDRHSEEGYSSQYLGFYELAKDGFDGLRGNHNAICALYFLSNDSNTAIYATYIYRDVVLEDIPGSESHNYEIPNYLGDTSTLEVENGSINDFIANADEMIESGYTFKKFNKWGDQ